MTFQVIKESVSSLNGWTGGMLLLLSLYLSARFEFENAHIKKKYLSQKINKASQNKAEQTTSA